jgi:hypothetical protein
MNQNIGAVAQIKKNALANKGEAKGAPAKSTVVKGEKAPKAPKEVTVKEPRQTLAQKCEALAKDLTWDEACKITPKTELMIYNRDQGRWQKAHFIAGNKDCIQAILAKDLFVIYRDRWDEGNENGKGIIAVGSGISTPEINEERIRKSFAVHPEYRVLPVWKDQFKSMIEEVEKGTRKAAPKAAPAKAEPAKVAKVADKK